MGYNLFRNLRVILLGLATATILAAPDTSYNASLPFRPNNVTGLSPLYEWVGSYVFVSLQFGQTNGNETKIDTTTQQLRLKSPLSLEPQPINLHAKM